MLYGIPSLSREIIRRTSYTDSNASWNSGLSGLKKFFFGENAEEESDSINNVDSNERRQRDLEK